MAKIFLVRHGQTHWNLSFRYQGHADIDLTEKGLLQAEALSVALKQQKIAAVYTSDLKRAINTGQIIAKPHDLSPQILPAFKEISFGLWEGMTYNEINKKWPGCFQKFTMDAEAICIPDGESFFDVQQRTMPALRNLINKHKNEDIVIVSHGAAIRTILAGVLHMPLKYVWSIKQDNTALNIIEHYEDHVILTLMNDTHHLE